MLLKLYAVFPVCIYKHIFSKYQEYQYKLGLFSLKQFSKSWPFSVIDSTCNEVMQKNRTKQFFFLVDDTSYYYCDIELLSKPHERRCRNWNKNSLLLFFFELKSSVDAFFERAFEYLRINQSCYVQNKHAGNKIQTFGIGKVAIAKWSSENFGRIRHSNDFNLSRNVKYAFKTLN